MIRTRDLVLFVLCLFVLGMAIMMTVRGGGAATALDIAYDETVPAYDGASAPSAIETDYVANRARLKQLIASQDLGVTPYPDDFVDDIPITETDTVVASDVAAAQYCLYPDDTLGYVSQWPQGARLSREGAYRVLSSTQTATLTASSSTPETVTKQLLVMPVSPSPLLTPGCVPSTIVGVTMNGTPLFNSNPTVWSAVAANTQIGYARDGYPIYGSYAGPVDECGGYQAPDGYRYVISPTQPYIVGCYHATPMSFTF